jgi:phospholipid-binding lipoprotein MlaA
MATRENPDPHESFNKDMLELNLAIDRNALKPAGTVYKGITTVGMRESVGNFLINLKEPFYFLNYLATAEGAKASNSLFRFVINSTAGILGIFDVGERIGLEKMETSHKSTLKTYRVPSGDYMVLPFLGPSSTRDVIAEPISWYIDPVGWFIGFPYMLAKAILSVIHERAVNSNVMDSAQRNPKNVYAITKSLYQQKYGTKGSDAYDADAESGDEGGEESETDSVENGDTLSKKAAKAI